MILQELDTLYDRLIADPDYKIFPPGFSLQKITFKVVLRPDGSCLSIEDIRPNDKGKRRPQQVRVLGNNKPSGSDLNPCFLWDNSAYLLGFKADDPKPERTRQAFEAFRDYHLELEDAVEASTFSAVCRFLEGWAPERAGEYASALESAATGFGLFQISGQARWAHEDPQVVGWWERHNEQRAETDRGQCLIRGTLGPIARLHPKIRGVYGAQGAGATIAGFNDDAYASYGKSQSFNAPVSQTSAFRYTAALNSLLDGPMRDKHRFPLGDTTVVFWTERPTITESLFARWAKSVDGSLPEPDQPAQNEDQRQKVEVFLRALRKGREAYNDLDRDSDKTCFFLLGLSPNAARLSIRFFHQGTLGDLLDNLRLHWRHIATTPQPAVGRRRADPEFPPLWLLLRQTARDTKDIPPILAGPLLTAVITGADYPSSLAAAIIRRIHADQRVTYPRVCAIKGFLVRNLNMEVNMSLDKERTDPAYRIGRLFATLEKTRKDALGDVGASIRDRFYSSASATPGSVFPRLLRTYQHHLAKLNEGQKVSREQLVQEILDPLDSFPSNFNLNDQGLFAIGYYHQTRDLYTKRNASEDASDR